MRIGVGGILSIDARLEDLRKRSPNEDYEEHKRNAKVIERILLENVALDLATITDKKIEGLFEELLEIDVHI